ncbi:putative mRNA (guanine-N(7))-methyltransferase [Helianthus annuus]|nr:putative mRNA (guanine-N(7))-methyltransferase [Helianthus annuus]
MSEKENECRNSSEDDIRSLRAKYQKNVEPYHIRSGGMKSNVVPNCIRSENYMITFEVEEEKYEKTSCLLFPFFGNKYQLKFANEASAETHCLVHFPSLIKAQFSEMLLEADHGLLDPRGSLLPKFYDILGLYTTFIFQKPDPDVAPPPMTPLLHESQIIDEVSFNECMMHMLALFVFTCFPFGKWWF